MKVCCPHCGVKGNADNSYIGKKIRCPKCKQQFVAALEDDTHINESVVNDNGPDSEKDKGSVVVSEKTVPVDPEEKREKVVLREYTIERLSGEAEEDEKDRDLAKDALATGETEVGPEPGDHAGPQPEAGQEAVDKEKPLQSPVPRCDRCGKAKESEEEFIHLETGDYCSLCGPLVKDELSVAAQAAAVAADGAHSSQAGVSSVSYSELFDEDGGQFSVGDILSKSWALTRGMKWPVWAGLLVTYGIMAVCMAVMAAVIAVGGDRVAGGVGIVGELVTSALSSILTAGLMFMGVKRVTQRRVVWKDIFSGFAHTGQVIVAAILQTLLVFIGFLLFVVPGIYLMVGYLMTMPLILDKQLSAWQAMEMSRKAIHKVWWKVFGLFFVISLICMISSIPMGIGLIWTIPLSVVSVGVLYKYLFASKKRAD